MEINYELYKVFYHVAGTLSFSKAADALCISQSAVSQSIKQLENKLNKTLLIRSTKKVSLTTDGELLLRHIEPAIHLILRGEQALLNETGGGQLRIGASDTICRYFLIPYLKKFNDNHKEIHIKVTNATSIGCVNLLKNNQVDLIIVNSPNQALNHLSGVTNIKDFQDVFVANNRFAKLQKQKLSLKDLLEYPILMLDKNSTTSTYLHQQFQRKQLELVPEIELNSNDLLIDLARIGLGIAFVPDFCLKNNSKGLFVLDVKNKLPKRQLVSVINEHSPVMEYVDIFMGYITY